MKNCFTVAGKAKGYCPVAVLVIASDSVAIQSLTLILTLIAAGKKEKGLDCFAAARNDGENADFLQPRPDSNSERQSKEILLDFDRNYPNTINEDNLEAIIEKAKKQQNGRGTR